MKGAAAPKAGRKRGAMLGWAALCAQPTLQPARPGIPTGCSSARPCAHLAPPCPPRPLRRFYATLRRKSQPAGLLTGIGFTGFGLGDSNYTRFM